MKKRVTAPHGASVVSDIDRRSMELVREFEQHFRVCSGKGLKNKREVFEGWALQKIASLQVLMLAMAAAQQTGKPRR